MCLRTVRLCRCRPYIYFNVGETQLQNDTDGILIVLLCSRKPSPTRKTMTPSVAIPVFVVCLQAFLFPSSSSSSFCISIGRTSYWNWIEQATATRLRHPTSHMFQNETNWHQPKRQQIRLGTISFFFGVFGIGQKTCVENQTICGHQSTKHFSSADVITIWQRGERGRRTRLIRTDIKFPVYLAKTEMDPAADVLLQRENLVFGIGRGMTSCVSPVWNRWKRKSWIVYM